MIITVTQRGFENMAGEKGTVVNVTGKKQTFVDSYQTLNVNALASHVIAGGLPQKKKERLKSQYCSTKVIKICGKCFCVDHIEFCPVLQMSQLLHQI